MLENLSYLPSCEQELHQNQQKGLKKIQFIYISGTPCIKNCNINYTRIAAWLHCIMLFSDLWPVRGLVVSQSSRPYTVRGPEALYCPRAGGLILSEDPSTEDNTRPRRGRISEENEKNKVLITTFVICDLKPEFCFLLHHLSLVSSVCLYVALKKDWPKMALGNMLYFPDNAVYFPEILEYSDCLKTGSEIKENLRENAWI